jgi:hypothetical protein
MVQQPAASHRAKLALNASSISETWQSPTKRSTRGSQALCKIRVMMAGDVIGAYDFEGNNGMCARYAAKLRS